MKEWISFHFSWQKFLVAHAFITLFAWSVTSSLYWYIVIGALLPSIFFLFLGQKVILLRNSLLILVVFLVINITATRNPLLFPIAYNGTLTYSEEFSHIGDSIYADEYPSPAYNQTVISPCFLDYSNREDNLQEPRIIPGVPYPVEVKRNIVLLSEIVPFYATEFTVVPKDVGGPYFSIVRRDIFDHAHNSQYQPDDLNYFNQCVQYNKPLVYSWVVVLEKLFVPFVYFSYLILGILLIRFCVILCRTIWIKVTK